MLTTGTAFDVLGAGIAAVTSDWGFLDETFAGADIRYGANADDLQQCLSLRSDLQRQTHSLYDLGSCPRVSAGY